MRVELTRPHGHYPLKVACLPIPPPGLESAKSSALSEKRGSNPRPRPWQGRALPTELFSHLFGLNLLLSDSIYFNVLTLSEKRGSNPRPRPWQGRALPTELFSHILMSFCLSDYSRFLNCSAKVRLISDTCKFFSIFF